jgi:thioesterase domain-containing protein
MGLLGRVGSLMSVDRETPGNVARVLLAGPVRFAGQAQFDAFYRRGMVVLQLHRPEPYDGPVLLVTAADEPVPLDVAAWDGLLTGPRSVVAVPGDHHGILRQPNVQRVAAELAARLATLSA